MAKRFTSAQWTKIQALFDTSAESFNLPVRRQKSVVIGSFNIREFGDFKGRSQQARLLLKNICERFDLLAIQEVSDDLTGLRDLKKMLGDKYGLVVSDMTGVFPGARGNKERLAFLFRWDRIGRTELASDITYDRTKVAQDLFERRADFARTFREHQAKLTAWDKACVTAKAQGKKKPRKPPLELPHFLTFIRQPHCASFQIEAKGSADPLPFLAVNAHLLWGSNKNERLWEFNALVDWLTIRAKQADRMYVPNIILLGDCNLQFEDIDKKRQEIDDRLKGLNKKYLKSMKAAKVNFPLLSSHPDHGFMRSNARATETYDQIGIFAHDARLPKVEENATAGQGGADAYDYGVFRFTELFSQALYGKGLDFLSDAEKKVIFDNCGFDVSDHLPIWFRVPVPGA